MKNIIRFGLILAAMLAATLLFTPYSYAQTTTQPTTTTRGQTIRCTIAQARLNTRITRVDTFRQAQSARFTQLQTRLDGFVTSAQTTDFDTTDLVDAQTAVKESITAYTTAATAYTTSLMATKNLSCAESDDDFTLSLISTRKLLTDLRQASQAVRTTFTEKAIPALQDYAAWLKDNRSPEGATE